ncbi:MAG: hypothetical protein D3914_18090, partial [Candidatus Electrothrix sp. LOE2]|nr:hypothetical protein [Candidatus Electrothrix sp. LOE2]
CDYGKDVKVSVEQRRGFVKRNSGGKGGSAQIASGIHRHVSTETSNHNRRKIPDRIGDALFFS